MSGAALERGGQRVAVRVAVVGEEAWRPDVQRRSWPTLNDSPRDGRLGVPAQVVEHDRAAGERQRKLRDVLAVDGQRRERAVEVRNAEPTTVVPRKAVSVAVPPLPWPVLIVAVLIGLSNVIVSGLAPRLARGCRSRRC